MGKRAYLDLYTSWAVAGRGGVVRGRALEGERPELGDHDDNLLERAWNTFELIETDEIPGVDVDVALFDEAASTPLRQLRVVTNDEGFFEAAVPAGVSPGRVRARATLVTDRFAHEAAENWLHVFTDEPGLAVISDIDDTVLISKVTDKLSYLKRLMFSGARDLETYPGAPELFQQFAAGGLPVFFVSGSPWNLEPRLRAFFAHRGFPASPLQLKDMGISESADSLMAQVEYKVREIREIFGALPNRRFVLLGDSGQQDPEIYAQIRRELPNRVAGAWIVNVTGEDPTAERFAGQRLCGDYEAIRDGMRQSLGL